MKKVICLVVFMSLFLSGCSTAAWETVEDGDAAVSALGQIDTYAIELDVVKDMTLVVEDEYGSVYSTQHGEMEVETRTFVASSPETAVAMLSGLSADTMTILQTGRFGLPEYQFVWVSHTEQGSRLNRADLLMDGVQCYAVICSTSEQAGNSYDEQLRHVFATFTLETEETV